MNDPLDFQKIYLTCLFRSRLQLIPSAPRLKSLQKVLCNLLKTRQSDFGHVHGILSGREKQNALFHPHILLNMYLYLISPSKLPHPILSTREQVWFLRLGLEKNPLEQNFQLSFRFVLFSLPQQVTFADEVLVLHQLWQLERKVSRKHWVSCLKTASKVENKTKWNYQKNVALKFRSIVITLSFWTLQVNMAVLNKFFHSKFLTLEYRWSNNLSWGLSCG